MSENVSAARRFFLVVNPNAGNRKLGRRWETEVYPFLKSKLPRFEFTFTERPGHATELTRQALVSGFTTIVAMGGDGTLNEVVNGFFENDVLTHKDTTLGILPFGSGGDFIRSVGIPRRYQDAVDILLNPKTITVDVGRVDFEKPEYHPRYFINIANAGVVAHVMCCVNALPRRLPPLWRYLYGTTKGFSAHENLPVQITFDNTTPRSVMLTNLIVANGQFFGRGMQPTPNANPGDGIFDILIYKNASGARFFCDLPSLYRGNFLPNSKFHETTRAHQIRIHPASADHKLWIEMDGETYGEGGVTFCIVPQAIRLHATLPTNPPIVL